MGRANDGRILRREGEVDPELRFDCSLGPQSEHNRDVADALGLTYNPQLRQYVDPDGCPTHDEFGQEL